MPLINYPTIPDRLFAKSAFGVAKEATFRTPVTPTEFTPFSSNTMEFDPALFSPPVMIGVRSTQVYNLSGQQKAGGSVGAPLYSVNGVPLMVAAVGQDGASLRGVFGTPLAASGAAIHAGSSTSFAAAGVVSITLTGITGTFAVGQAIQIAGATDGPIGDGTFGPVFTPDVVRVTAFSSPTITCTATAQVHTGTILVRVVGSSVASGGAAASSTVTLTTGQGALFTTGDAITIDVNGTTTTAESRTTTVAGDVITVDTAFGFSHAANALVYRVSSLAVFWHTVLIGDPDSFTFEKNIADVESLQFAGARVGKLTLHAPMGNVAATIAADIEASAIAVLPTPTAVVTNPNPPFTFKDAQLNIFGVGRFEAYNHQIVLDNHLKQTWTYSRSGLPSYNTATDLSVEGTFDAVWDSFDDSTTGYWKKMHDEVEGNINFTLQHPVDSSFVYWECNKVKLSKVATAPTPANVAMQSLAFRARHAIEDANPTIIKLIIGVPGKYLPY